MSQKGCKEGVETDSQKRAKEYGFGTAVKGERSATGNGSSGEKLKGSRAFAERLGIPKIEIRLARGKEL